MLIDYKKANIYQNDGVLVLENVDFHVDEGEFIYIIGRVGAGKSSLLKTLYFELDVDEAETAVVQRFEAQIYSCASSPDGYHFPRFSTPERPYYTRQLGIRASCYWLAKERRDRRAHHGCFRRR